MNPRSDRGSDCEFTYFKNPYKILGKNGQSILYTSISLLVISYISMKIDYMLYGTYERTTSIHIIQIKNKSFKNCKHIFFA